MCWMIVDYSFVRLFLFTANVWALNLVGTMSAAMRSTLQTVPESLEVSRGGADSTTTTTAKTPVKSTTETTKTTRSTFNYHPPSSTNKVRVRTLFNLLIFFCDYLEHIRHPSVFKYSTIWTITSLTLVIQRYGCLHVVLKVIFVCTNKFILQMQMII